MQPLPRHRSSGFGGGAHPAISQGLARGSGLIGRTGQFLVESGIIYPQEGDARDYEHNFVVREVLTDNVFGDPLASVGAEEVIEYTLEADLPRSVLVPENTSVIIAVARPGSADSAGSLTYSNVTYMDLDIYDNAVIVPANGSVDLAYEE